MGTVSWPDWPICSDRGPARESPLDFGVTATHGVEMVSRKPLAPPPIEIKQFTLDEIERGIAKLQRRIAEVEAIDSRHAAEPSAPERSVVTSNIRETIREVFGTNSPELHEHNFLDIWAGGMRMGMPREEIGALAARRPGRILERNLDAMNPEARCRAVAHASRGANRETG